jgi:uncharacterized protein with PQ loop repeat
MVEPAVTAAAFALGSAGNLLKGLPQFVTTALRGRVAGLAPGAVWLALVANVLWLCFGISIGDAGFAALSALGVALTGGTLVRFAGSTAWSRHSAWAAPSVCACMAFVLLALLGQDSVLALVGVALGVVISLPQLLHLWRLRSSHACVSGVSRAEILVVIAAQVGWTVYWLTQGQLIVAAGAAYGLLARAVTLALLQRQRRRAARSTL